MRYPLIRLIAVLAAVCSLQGRSFAADYPERPAKLIVPFAPGGAVDYTARLIAEVAPQYFGKKIIVQNMPGGGAVIGQTFVANARPDGYTLLAYTSSVVNNPITKKTTYTHESFLPVAMFCFDPEVLVVAASSTHQTLPGLIDAAKTREVTVATAGYSTSHHVAGLVVQKKSGAKFSYIHNPSAAMQLQQLMGGHVEVGFMSLGEATSYVKNGNLRMLGIASRERSEEFPDVPSFIESGIDMEWGTFRGIAVPKETRGEIVSYLANVLHRVVEHPKFIEGMTKAGYPIVYYGPDEFQDYIERQAILMGEILPTLNDVK